MFLVFSNPSDMSERQAITETQGSPPSKLETQWFVYHQISFNAIRTHYWRFTILNVICRKPHKS